MEQVRRRGPTEVDNHTGAAMITTPDWYQDAACLGMDTEIFFPGQGEDQAAALNVCKTCPAVEQCLEYAIRTGEKLGIWGGMGARQRDRLRRGPKLSTPVATDACGTYAGYRRHYRLGGTACVACREARHAYEQERRKQRRRAAS